MPIFPSYGPLQQQRQIVLVVPNLEILTVFSITGKAIVFGGSLQFILDENDPTRVDIVPVVDGIIFDDWSLTQLLENNWVDNWNHFVHLTQYNFETGYYSITIDHHIPIGTDFALRIQNATGDDVHTIGDLFYHNVQ